MKKQAKQGTVQVVGIGPGAADLITPRARQAIEAAGVVLGYRTYLDLVADLLIRGQQVVGSTMMQEMDRCRQALDLAAAGQQVVLVCGGDPGIYAMAGLIFELARSRNFAGSIEIIPGVAALNSCAAILGAPLMHDFAVISLSDLMTPWPVIEKRLQAAAAADFVTVLYNPRSKKRTQQIVRAREIFLAHRSPTTPVGLVTSAFRRNEAVHLATLESMVMEDINMQSTVIIGNQATFVWQGKLVTPRGYAAKYGIGQDG